MTLKIVNFMSTYLSMIPFLTLSPSYLVSDVLPSAAVEKTGTMLSDGAIYSSIDFMGKAGYSSPARGSQPTPYATTQILQSNSFHELAVDRPDPRWKASLQAQQEIANLGYSLTDRRPCSGTRHGGIRGGVGTIELSVGLCLRRIGLCISLCVMLYLCLCV